MSENAKKAAFDPHHRWLGIRPEEQPATHYRLLGLSAFEDDPEAIRDAAARQMAHVRTYQLGPNAAISQKILNELAAAKACLLDPASKAEYDQKLLAGLGHTEVQKAESPAAMPTSPAEAIPFDEPEMVPLEPAASIVDTALANMVAEFEQSSRPAGPTAKKQPPVTRPTNSFDWTRNRLLAVGGTALLAISVLFAVLFRPTPKADGTLIVQISDPEATVQVLDAQGTLLAEQKAATEKLELSIPPGKGELRVVKNDNQLFSKEFTLASGERESFKVPAAPKPGPVPPPHPKGMPEILLTQKGKSPPITAAKAEVATVRPVNNIPASEPRPVVAPLDSRAQRQPPPAEKPAEASPAPAPPAMAPELLKQRRLDAAFAAAMRSVESMVAGWDFKGAIQELAKVRFDSKELTARLAARRDQIRRMADLKERMIAMINQADPRLEKSDLALRGINGQIDKADAEAIAATLPTGKQESHAWPELGSEAVNKMLSRVVRREDAGDWLAAGLLSMAGKDTQAAERYFDKAQSLGSETAPCRALLAAIDFAEVRNLLGKQMYVQSEARLAALQEKYGKLPWFAANQPEWDAVAKEVKRGLREKDAKTLYARAAALFQQGDLYEMKPLVVRFKTEYADSAVAADPQRKPSLAELEKAVADLGPLLRVRKDGQGDAKSIQEAVNKASRNAMIQIEEAGPWTELIVVPAEKEGLTIRGKKGLLPLITTAGAANSYTENFVVHAAQFSLERLKIVRDDAGGSLGAAITAEKASLSVRGAIVHGHARAGKLDARQSVFTAGVHVLADVDARDCAFFGLADFRSSCAFQNVLVSGNVNCGSDSRLRHCTIKGQLQLSGISGAVSDSILSAISADDEGQTVEHCDVFGDNPYRNKAAAGKGCITARPLFVDAKDLDFKLQPGSPCRKAASDGSDMGFAPTPEVQALLNAAADLRNRTRKF